MGKTGRRHLRLKGRVNDDVDPDGNDGNDATNIDTLLESNGKYKVKEKRRYSDQNTSVAKVGGQQQCTMRMHRRVIYHTNALLKANVPRSDGTRRHRVHPVVDMRLDLGP